MRSAKILFLVLVATVSQGCGPQAEKTVVADESLETGKVLVRGYMEQLINGHEWDAWDEYYNEILVFNGHEMSRHDMRTMAETFGGILEGFRVEIEEQIAEGDTVATRVTFHGTHTGDYMGLKASGKTLTFGGLALDRIEEGKIVESWHQMDIWGTLLMASDD